MRKVLSICVFISYVLSASGICISLHHCAGELKYISVGKDDDHEVKCCKGKTDMPDGCCNSNTISFKKIEDNNLQPFFTIENILFDDVDIPHFVSFVTTHIAGFYDRSVILFRPPPNRTGTLPLYIFLSVFRI